MAVKRRRPNPQLGEVQGNEIVGLAGETVGGYVGLSERLPFVPTTVWTIKGDDEYRSLLKLVGDTGQSRSGSFMDGSRDEGAGFMPGATNGASVFPPSLVQQVVAGYTQPGDLVIDPFGGGGTRAIVSALLKRRYVGVELREAEAQRVRDRIGELSLDGLASIITADSTSHVWAPHLPGAADLLLTCPPYWTLERYSDQDDDLSTDPSYASFLNRLSRVIKASHFAVAEGKFSVWVVGEFRDPRTGNLLDFPGDVCRLHQEAGFALYDRAVYSVANTAALARVGVFDRTRKLVRLHGHVLVFRAGG